MQRGAGNKIKNSYKRRSPLREPISIISALVSTAAGAINKSNKKAKDMGTKGTTKGLKQKSIAEMGASAGADAVKPMKSGLK